MDSLYFILTFLGLLTAYFFHKLNSLRQKTNTFFSNLPFPIPKKTLLLIIAHPDDESMFFLPSIEQFKQNFYNISLLCLTNGDFDGLGKIREVELMAVKEYIDINQLTIINHMDLKDGMNKTWDITLIKDVIQAYWKQNPADIIVTFDEGGISQHPNHIAVSNGVKAFYNDYKPMKVELYELVSVNIIRKYIGLLDILLIEEKPSIITLMNLNIYKNYKAMRLHYSQFVWFRKLFVFFSRYSFFNTLRKYSV